MSRHIASTAREVTIFLAVGFLASLAAYSPARAGEQTFTGSLGAEVRWFPSDPELAGQLEGGQASVTVIPEYRYRTEDGKHRFAFEPFFRWDGRDRERTHGDLRQAYWRYVGNGWELLLGVDRVFWGVTESRHLVDVVNQSDFVEDVDDEDKLGQPMLALALQRDWGRLEALGLIGFRERTFPGKDGRLRTPLPVDADAASYESGADDDRIDLALRYSHYIGDWDVGAHVFHGTGREPVFVPDATGSRLLPFYFVTNQLGVDVQYTRGAWLWKAEGLWREGQGSTFGAAVAGFEYTKYQLAQSAADLGLLVELQLDGRDATAPGTLSDHDVFAGTRLALNDTQDTSVLAGVIYDWRDGSISGRVEAERRLGGQLSLELEAQWFSAIDPTDPIASVESDDFVNLRLSWSW